MEKNNSLRSPDKLHKLNNKESKVRAKESTQHSNTKTKEKKLKGPTDITYQEDEKLRERSVKGRTEGLKLRVKKLRVVTGKHVRLEVFDEHGSNKPTISSRRVYATRTDIIKESVSDAPFPSGSSTLTHSFPNISAKRFTLSPCPVKKNPKPKI